MICKVSDAFLDSEAEFDFYSKYCLVMTRVQKLITKTHGVEKIINFVDQKFQQLSKTLGKSPKFAPGDVNVTKTLTMEHLVLKPFQRIVQYPLILERIEQKCEKGTVDKEKIRKAIQLIKNEAVKMNESLKKDETSNAEYDDLLKQYEITK